MAQLSKEEIKHIANLAKLRFSDIELEKFAEEFNSILNYISLIKECDTQGIEFQHHMHDFRGNILQEDKVKPSLNREEVFKNATEGRNKNGYIRTSKIVNKE
jgi:aspartyl-tRNA(Asn)/glutamyl-tRNA(Gln) amidotransferase subunit C